MDEIEDLLNDPEAGAWMTREKILALYPHQTEQIIAILDHAPCTLHNVLCELGHVEEMTFPIRFVKTMLQTSDS